MPTRYAEQRCRTEVQNRDAERRGIYRSVMEDEVGASVQTSISDVSASIYECVVPCHLALFSSSCKCKGVKVGTKHIDKILDVWSGDREMYAYHIKRNINTGESCWIPPGLTK